ncbi:MAG TPA: PAS domain-containing sensor histidine kinase [Puia sp.]|nr:PAS domain-containing sensor histidine kinase [Puia sp.]
MEPGSAELNNELEDFFEHPLCGFLTADPGGRIKRANHSIASWIGCKPEELIGRRFSDLLTMGGKIYYETHLWPLLRMQGFFDEVAVELNAQTGEKKQVLVNAFEQRDSTGEVRSVQITVFKASDRRLYEQNLKEEKARAEQKLTDEKMISGVREQFIAVLGHDLRNPLSSIVTAASILSEETDIAPHKPIIDIISRSASRMAELISNIMDFARARMGSGIVVIKHGTNLEPVLQHVVNEIAIAWPRRIIETKFEIIGLIDCDAPRIAQLFSNLLANALTHGTQDAPVQVRAFNKDDFFELSVSNQGIPIPPAAIEKLFHPFTREGNRPSQQGLGLGLFIASEIARGHGGQLTVHSDETETRFTLRFKISD